MESSKPRKLRRRDALLVTMPAWVYSLTTVLLYSKIKIYCVLDTLIQKRFLFDNENIPPAQMESSKPRKLRRREALPVTMPAWVDSLTTVHSQPTRLEVDERAAQRQEFLRELDARRAARLTEKAARASRVEALEVVAHVAIQRANSFRVRVTGVTVKTGHFLTGIRHEPDDFQATNPCSSTAIAPYKPVSAIHRTLHLLPTCPVKQSHLHSCFFSQLRHLLGHPKYVYFL